ncbi:MAG: 2-amino-4-hydroxy-6-hydroxymethyldihydropteridine diphosphokinase [Betaproteobacteria bacterium]|nr:2-amino-4-hydroxy-6-hydroxymethyldihydropteridine diphosphokinase [Betaproteobacteria bacterium]
MRPLVPAWISIGANLGGAVSSVLHAIENLKSIADSSLIRASSLYQTQPIDAQGPAYINAAVLLHTHLIAPSLLQILLHQEIQAGRLRPYPNAPRVLDLDLIFFGDAHIQSHDLIVPHPRWSQRAFVMIPLQEIDCPFVDLSMLDSVAHQSIKKIPTQDPKTMSFL